MTLLRVFFSRWGVAILIMLAIFLLSSRPGPTLPDFGWADAALKKSGHVVGYALLALSYWHALGWKPGGAIHAWVLAVLYGFTDEIHQVFVPGRHPSAVDVLFFDGTGAALALWVRLRILARQAAGARDKARLR